MSSVKRILAAGAALLLLSGCAAETHARQETILSETVADKVKTYETYEVVPSDIVKSGTMSLSVVYTQSQVLKAPDNGLYLEEVCVQRKDQIAEGTVIATFRRPSSEADLAEAQLNLRRAQETLNAQLEMLQANIDNAQGDIALELAQLQYERAAYLGQRQLKSLQAAVDTAQAAFELVELKAPYDCIIDSVAYLYDQQKVDVGTEIVEISRLSSMALVGETGTNNFQYGNKIQVEYGKKDNRRSVSARVVSTSTLLGSDGQKIWILLDEPIAENVLTKPSAQAEIVQIQGALTVPRAAVESENGNAYVQILVDGVAHKRYIIRGINVGTAGEGHVVVLSGLEAGQLVITN